MKKKSLLLVLLLALSAVAFPQEPTSVLGTMTILDTLVVKHYDENAVRLNVRLSFDTADSVVIYYFNENVNYSSFYSNWVKKYGRKDAGNKGLSYVIEDENGEQIYCGIKMCLSGEVVDYPPEPTEGPFVDTTCMKICYKRMPKGYDSSQYEIAKFVVPRGDTVVQLYPMIIGDYESVFPRPRRKFGQDVMSILRELNPIPPGRYKLFLYYSQLDYRLPRFFDTEWNENNTVFLGVMQSNAIDLIIEEEPPKWWQFWKKK